ncbi:hypothetical protein AV530_003795 [Patagioenas fasciata monilis]|uniref:Uncharacterized protein n=1 Tax=Patagioenas fasciata monilis TaxID=372326 RepID=A0A1V4KYI8_PATFA|nr:hypothetical protein AV530_003795 [Patagioenas fasciata monilis]
MELLLYHLRVENAASRKGAKPKFSSFPWVEGQIIDYGKLKSSCSTQHACIHANRAGDLTFRPQVTLRAAGTKLHLELDTLFSRVQQCSEYTIICLEEMDSWEMVHQPHEK